MSKTVGQSFDKFAFGYIADGVLHQRKLNMLRTAWIKNVCSILNLSELEAAKAYDRIQPFKGL